MDKIKPSFYGKIASFCSAAAQNSDTQYLGHTHSSRTRNMYSLSFVLLVVCTFYCCSKWVELRAPQLNQVSRGRTYPFFEDIISYPYPGPIKGYYILSLSRQKKRIWIYILYPFVPKVIKYICKTPALSQFLNNEKPDLLAHKSLTFYRIKLKPRSISGAARKWQILPLKPKSQALNVEKRI
jgi:hypothetical protein